jgi:hypothetical protein
MRSLTAFVVASHRIGRQMPFNFLVVLAFSINSPILADSPNNVQARFLEQYGPNAKALQDYYNNIEFKSTRTTIGPENTLVDEINGKCALGCFLGTGGGKAIKNKTGETYFDRKPYIEGINPSYSFKVARKESGNYAARDVTLAKQGEQSALGDISVPFANSFRRMTYLDIAKNADTTFLALEDHVWQNQPVKMLRTEYTDMFKSRTTAEYYFLPENGWLCRGQRLSTTDASEYAEEIYSYEPREGEPFPALRRMEQWVHDDKNPAKTRRTSFTEVSEFRHAGPFPESDFRLTAFGLPEPAAAKPPSWPLWWSYSLGGIGLAIAAVLFALLARRFRKKTGPSRAA